MFRRFLGTAAQAVSVPATSAPASPTAGETATVRRIVARLEAMPPDRARLIASAAYTLARAAHADLDISDEETAAIEAELQRDRRPRRGDRRARHRDGQAPGEDRRRDRGLRRHPRVQGAVDAGAAPRRPARLLRDQRRERHDLGRGDAPSSTRSRASSTSTHAAAQRGSAPSTTIGSRRSSRCDGSPAAADRGAAPDPRGPTAEALRLTRSASRTSTSPSPSRRRISASSSAS